MHWGFYPICKSAHLYCTYFKYPVKVELNGPLSVCVQTSFRSSLCVWVDSTCQSEGQRWHMRSSGCEMSFMISTTFLKQPVLSESDLPPFDGSPCAGQSRQSCKQHNPQQFRARSLIKLRLWFVDSSLPASACFLRAGTHTRSVRASWMRWVAKKSDCLRLKTKIAGDYGCLDVSFLDESRTVTWTCRIFLDGSRLQLWIISGSV